MNFGFGFTDVAKRPSARASDLTQAEFMAGIDELLTKLKRYAPRVACFHGLMGYRFVHRVIASDKPTPALGLQQTTLGGTHVFVVPNPSPANAHFTPAEQTAWYDRLAEYVAMTRTATRGC
jgi:TDG/mug DNA glycosylase family protein